MPYGYRRRGGRFGRRYRSRRRSFRGRRRPSASRAVLRGTTLAPRHQLLKLRTAFNVTADETITAAYEGFAFMLFLQDPSNPFRAISGPLFGIPVTDGPTFARGWNAYKNLFNEYCVAGAKVELQATVDRVVATTNNQSFELLTLANPLSNLTASLVAPLNEWTSLPLGTRQSVSKNIGYNTRFKRYYNMNRMFGEIVKKHDKYVHEWPTSGSSPTGSDFTSGSLNVALHNASATGNSYSFTATINVKITWYIHAMSVNTEITPSGPSMAFLKEVSEPMTEMLGEPLKPDLLGQQDGMATGEPKNAAGAAAAGQVSNVRADGKKRMYPMI